MRSTSHQTDPGPLHPLNLLANCSLNIQYMLEGGLEEVPFTSGWHCNLQHLWSKPIHLSGYAFCAKSQKLAMPKTKVIFSQYIKSPISVIPVIHSVNHKFSLGFWGFLDFSNCLSVLATIFISYLIIMTLKMTTTQVTSRNISHQQQSF